MQYNHVKWWSRLEKENQLIEPCEKLAPLPASAWWDIRYYDSLRNPSVAASQAAHSVLNGLQSVNVHNPMTAAELRTTRQNSAMQGNSTSCGFHVLHFIETEMRRSMGEGVWPASYDVAKRVQLLSPLWAKLR